MRLPPGEAVGGGLALNGSSTSICIYICIYIYRPPPMRQPPTTMSTPKDGVRKL